MIAFETNKESYEYGYGSPEGVEYGPPRLFLDKSSGDVWVKQTPSDVSTGWKKLSTGSGGLITATPSDKAELFGVFTYGDIPGVTDIIFNHTHSIAGFDVENLQDLISISFPNLIDVDPSNTQGGYILIANNPNLLELLFPKLVSVTQNVGLIVGTGNSLLTSIALPEFISGLITVRGNAGLVDLFFPKYVPVTGSQVRFDANALSAASVNHVLARCVANAGYVTGTVSLDGGTNAAPTGQGIADVATLIARGVAVNTN